MNGGLKNTDHLNFLNTKDRRHICSIKEISLFLFRFRRSTIKLCFFNNSFHFLTYGSCTIENMTRSMFGGV